MPVQQLTNGFGSGLRDALRGPTPAGEQSPRGITAIESPVPQIDAAQRPRLGGPGAFEVFFNPGFRQFNGKWGLVGTTVNEDTGAVIPSVTVDLYDSATKAWLATTVSDASGNFAFLSGPGSPVAGSLSRQYFCVGYLPGSPDQAGTTLNTLRAGSVA